MSNKKSKTYFRFIILIVALLSVCSVFNFKVLAATSSTTVLQDVYTDSHALANKSYIISDRLSITDDSGLKLVNYVGRNTSLSPALTFERAAVKFSLSGISGTISSASLKIYVVDVHGSPVLNLISTNNDSWDETVTPSPNFPTFNSTDIISTTSTFTPNSWLSFDVKNYIQSKINAGATVADFVLTGLEGTGVDEIDFVSNLDSTTSYWSKIDITYTPAANPPVVTGPSLTKNSKPTWTWTAGGGGNGTFRYKLDDTDLTSGATTTTSLNYTPPSAQSDGPHILYVQESNGLGGWSTSGSFTITVDTSAPNSYNPTIDQAFINNANKTAMSFTFAGAEVGATYSYTVSSSGGGTNVTGSGTITSATQQITGINTTGLNDGTLTLSVTLTDPASNAGTAVTKTVTKDIAAPAGYNVTINQAFINNTNKSAMSFNFAGAEIGATYNYTVSSSGGGTNATGNGTISSATQSVSGINVSGLNDGTLTLSVTLSDPAGNTGTAATKTVTKDIVAPSGYSVSIDQTAINNVNKTAMSFTFAGAEVGATYNYTVSSSGGGSNVTGSGTVTSATQQITGINTTGLNDGTLTLSVTLTDAAGNTGSAATKTVTKNTVAPSGYSVTIDQTVINNVNKTAMSFTFANAVIGTTYNYTISSSGGGTNVTGSGTVSSATQQITGINVSGLNDGTLTLSVTLTDTVGNVGNAATKTVTKDIAAPNGYSVTINQASINNTNKTAMSFTFAGAEVGATYNYTVSSSGGGTNATGNGTVTSATQQVTGINVTSLNDGTLTLSVTLTDTAGNTGSAATKTVTRDTIAPVGYSVAIDQAVINNANKTAMSFTFTGAEVGATYNYTVSSSGGGTNTTGSGTIAGATQQITGINVSGLNDGTLTLSVTLTDTAGNTGTAATKTVSKDSTAPTGYSVTINQAFINNANKTAMSFTFAGAEVGATYNYTASSSGGGTNVTGNGTISSVTQSLSGINVSGLNDGILTLSVTLTDTAGNPGTAATKTVTKDIVAPGGYSITIDQAMINNANQAAMSFTFAGAEVGATYNYTVSSSGGGTNVTGSGTASSATQKITGINVTGLNDGILTLSVTLTDAAGNTGSAATKTVTKNTAPPSGYSVTIDQTIINNVNKTAMSFTFANAVIGTTYNYTVSSSGGGTNVTGSGTISSASQQITGINVTGLNDGTLTLSVTLTDTVGNVGNAATKTVTKDITAPSGYSVSINQAFINNSNKAAMSFTFAGVETGATYNYTVASSGGGTNVTGSGTITSATQQITGINATGLNDGTLTLSVTLTDTAGNAGSAVTKTVTKDTVAPTITFLKPVDGSTVNISTGSTVIANIVDNGAGIGTGDVQVQIDDGDRVNPSALTGNTHDYTLYYIIATIDYAKDPHKLTVTVTDVAGNNNSKTVYFHMNVERNGFGFGKLRFN